MIDLSMKIICFLSSLPLIIINYKLTCASHELSLYGVVLVYLGASIGVKCAVIVGGMDMMSQALILAKKPHILIATPGRLIDHLENTKGFSLRFVNQSKFKNNSLI